MRTGGAALGAGSGRAITNMTEGKPAMEGVPQDAGMAAAGQGLGEAAAPVAGTIGKGLVRSSIVTKGKEAAKAAAEMVSRRIPVGGVPGLPSVVADVPAVGPSLVRGSRVAADNYARALAERNAVNRAAQAAGTTIPRKTVEDAIKGLISDTSNEMGSQADINYLKKALQSWKDRKLEQLQVPEVQRILTRFDAGSAVVHNAANKGITIPTAAQQAKAAYQRRVADALRGAVRKAVDRHQEVSSELSSAIAAKKAVNASEPMAGPAMMAARAGAGTVVGGAIGGVTDRNHWRGAEIGAGLGALGANSPQATSRLGLLMTDPALMALLRNSPRLAADALRTKGQ